MPSKKKLDDYYMSLALRVAELSHGRRAKVGCCLITDNDLTVLGTNGLPKQLGNELEYEENYNFCNFGDGTFHTPEEARESYWNMKKKYIEDVCSKWEGIICQDVIDSLRSITFEDLN